jgi:hypothetical protein
VDVLQPALYAWQDLCHGHLVQGEELRGIMPNTSVEQGAPTLPAHLPHTGQDQAVYNRAIAPILASVNVQPIESCTKASTEL